MRKLFLTVTAITLAAAVCTNRAAADPVPAGAQVDFVGGTFGNWNIVNTSSAGVEILQVKINLAQNGTTPPGNLYFDPTSSSPGELLSYPFTPQFGAGATGFASVSGNTDGSISLTLTFNGFDPGEAFNFELDVDHTRPTGTSNILNRQNMTGFEMAGTTVDITFGGSNITPATFSGTFGSIDALLAQANVNGTVERLPEPTSLLLLGAGLTGVVAWRRRRVA